MTLRPYGRATPIQLDMLSLGGEWLSRSNKPPTEKDRLEAMRRGRSKLVQVTQNDFGYDLKAWHEFLLAGPPEGASYTHPYAWNLVRPKIESLIDDPDRLRRAAMLEAELSQPPSE